MSVAMRWKERMTRNHVENHTCMRVDCLTGIEEPDDAHLPQGWRHKKGKNEETVCKTNSCSTYSTYIPCVMMKNEIKYPPLDVAIIFEPLFFFLSSFNRTFASRHHPQPRP